MGERGAALPRSRHHITSAGRPHDAFVRLRVSGRRASLNEVRSVRVEGQEVPTIC